jgi:hypothetical protein
MTADQDHELIDFLGRKFDQIDRRFDAIDHRFDVIDIRFERLESRVTGVEVLQERHGDLIQQLAEGLVTSREEVGRRFEEVDRRFDSQEGLIRALITSGRNP